LAGLGDEEARLLAEVSSRDAEEIDRNMVSQRPDVRRDLSREAPLIAETSARLGVASMAALPLVADGALLGALWVGSQTVAEFDDEKVYLLMEIAGDLAFGISNLRVRAERMGILEKLEHSLDHAVTAIAATVEMRALHRRTPAPGSATGGGNREGNGAAGAAGGGLAHGRGGA